jgi:hypothetical protein
VSYDPGPVGPHPQVTRAALAAADATIDWQMADASRAVLAFLEHMSANYVGDYYIEGALDHLVTMVRELPE